MPAPTVNDADVNRGGPIPIAGLREKPNPSLGRKSRISIRPLAFSSWIIDTAYVPAARFENRAWEALADIVSVRAVASPRQSGNLSALLVRQIKILPRVLRALVMVRSTAPVADVLFCPLALAEINRVAVSAAKAVP